MRPFSDHACPDDEGNAVPFDTPDTALLLEREPTQAAWPVRLVEQADIQLQPSTLRAFRTIEGLAAVPPPQLLYPANVRRSAVNLWVWESGVGNSLGFRIARSPFEATRDESSMIVTFVSSMLRFRWSEAMWVQQRQAGLGTWLMAQAEDWAR